jgi:hypothetical protein
MAPSSVLEVAQWKVIHIPDKDPETIQWGLFQTAFSAIGASQQHFDLRQDAGGVQVSADVEVRRLDSGSSLRTALVLS